MMARYLVAAACLGLPALASAQTVDPSQGRLEILGTAPSACVMRAPGSPVGTNASFDLTGSSSGRIRILEMINPASATARGATMDLTLPVICNGPHQVSVQSRGGMLRQGDRVTNDAFADRVNYSLTADWGGQQARFTTGESDALAIDVASGRAGLLRLSIAIPAGGRPLVAGRYEDQIILEMRAAN